MGVRKVKTPLWAKFAIKTLLSCVLLFIVFSKTRDRIGEVGNTLASVQVWHIFAGILLFVCLIALKAIRWKSLIAQYGGNMSIRECFLAYMGGIAMGAVTPGRIGEFARAYIVSSKTSLSTHDSILTVMADRLFDLIVLTSLGLSGLCLITLNQPLQRIPFILFAFVLLFFLGIKLASAFLSRFKSRIARLKLGKVSSFFEELLRLVDFNSIALWAYTFTAYSVYFIASYFVVRIAGIEEDIFTVSLIISVAGLVVLLPVSIAGLGAREMVFVTMFSALGVDKGVALGASILHFALFFGLGSLLGCIALLIFPISARGARSVTINDSCK